MRGDRAQDGQQAGDGDPVRALQRKLYRAAKQSRSRRFHALFDKVHRKDVLWAAWSEVARNSGAPGVDGVTISSIEQAGVGCFLDELHAELVEGRYRPLPVRRVTIPKRAGGERHLGVPCVRDRVVQAAWKLVVEPVFEAGFADVSFGFRPRRSAHQACEAIRVEADRGAEWVLDADVRDCLGGSSHCPLAVAEGVEQATVGLGDLDTQALSCPGADVDGAELAALDTLQHRLPRDPSAMVASSIGSQPTSMDICPDGSAAVVVTYFGAFLFPRKDGETWGAAFSRPPVELEPHRMRQAEAVAFSRDGSILRVVSEGGKSPIARYLRAGKEK